MEENDNDGVMVVNRDYGFPNFPPGYRFKPDDDELIDYYLVNKIENRPLPPNKISEVNFYRYNPEELAANHPHYEEEEWYFFTSRDRKYPNGSRPSRSAGCGFWKASGVDKEIISNGNKVGVKKTLVFYKKKTEEGKKDEKTDWIMQEYVLADDRSCTSRAKVPTNMKLNDWVLCKIYERKVTNAKTSSSEEELVMEEENVSPHESKPAEIVPPPPPPQIIPPPPQIISPPPCKTRGRKRKALGVSIKEEKNPIVESNKRPIIKSDQNEGLLSKKPSPPYQQLQQNPFSTDLFQMQYPFPVSYYDFPSPNSPTAFNMANDHVFKSQAKYTEGFVVEQENGDVIHSGNAYDSFDYSVHLDVLPDIIFPEAHYPGILPTGISEGL